MPEEPKNNIHQILDDLIQPNIFDKLITEITPTVIPAELIEHIAVIYNNGKVVELKGTDLTQPVPVKNYQTKEQRKETRKHIADVRIFIDTKKLAVEVNNSVDKLFAQFNLL